VIVVEDRAIDRGAGDLLRSGLRACCVASCQLTRTPRER